VYGASGLFQVGTLNGHASLWQGTPESRVDLNPAGSALSYARAIAGTRQFGFVYPGSTTAPARAAMWSGTAASYLDLNPPGAVTSYIIAAYGEQQGGNASFVSQGGPFRAGLWSGTAGSFVSLHPGSQFTDSFVGGMAEGEQVGAVATPGTHHAALWHGTAQSFLDLNPPAYNYSELLATIGGVEVGYVYTGLTYAGIWYGSASSFVNLGQFLPAGYHDSRATSIATDGTSYFVGGYAFGPSGYPEAFLWTGPVPAPAGLTLLLGAGLIAVRRRR
jgi:hypothetical protein